MNDFARVLNEIIVRGKQQKVFSIKKLADQAGIAASYLSNLKQGNQNPPAHNTLLEITDALRHFNVAEAEIQRLLDVYTRTLLGFHQTGNLLETLCKEPNLDTVSARIRGALESRGTKTRSLKQDKIEILPVSDVEEGDYEVLIHKTLLLLEEAGRRGIEGGKMYLTWFHAVTDASLKPLRKKLRETLSDFLGVDSPFSLFHLWSSNVSKALSVIVDFLLCYFGTTNCYLYEISESRHLPEYVAIEGVGFIEARPALNGRFRIHTVLVQDEEDVHWKELESLLAYLEYLLGPEEQRRPLIQTEASYILYADTPSMRNLAESEQQAVQDRRLLIKPIFSDLYKSEEGMRAYLKSLSVPQKERDAFLANHARRRMALAQRHEQGKEYTIHEREALRYIFKHALTQEVSEDTGTAELARLLQAQLFEVLRTLHHHPTIHFALTEQQFPVQLAVAGGKATFVFDLPEFRYRALMKDEIALMAWTNHPDIIHKLQQEFEGIWNGIEADWRTDTEAGRHNITNFLIAESLKALIDADVPPQKLWAFMHAIADHAQGLDVESFRRELLAYEQGAQEMVIVSQKLPYITVPVGIGHWDVRSLTRTRQRLLYSILREIRRFRLIITQRGLEEYWDTNFFSGQRTKFERAWTEEHFAYLHQLLLKMPDVISMEILPLPVEFPVNFEIVDRKILFFEKFRKGDDEGGIVLKDEALAQNLLQYVERHLSANCPENLKGALKAAKWLEERFGIA